MTMRFTCPKCRQPTLIALPGQPRPVEDQDAPLSCTQCHGVWIPPLAADELRHEGRPISHGHEGSAPEGVDRKGGMCPRGHGILTRARVEVTPPFFLERCQACRGIWFDAGEFERTAADPMFAALDKLWDPDWQKRQRDEHARLAELERLERALGRDAMGHLAELARLLERHPHRGEALAWLSARFGGHSSGN